MDDIPCTFQARYKTKPNWTITKIQKYINLVCILEFRTDTSNQHFGSGVIETIWFDSFNFLLWFRLVFCLNHTTNISMHEYDTKLEIKMESYLVIEKEWRILNIDVLNHFVLRALCLREYHWFALNHFAIQVLFFRHYESICLKSLHC